jgi:hypothetical protein
MCYHANFGQRDPVTYTELREEALPSLFELVAEHQRMLREIEAAKRAQQSSFYRTWSNWSRRELLGAREEKS